ncbi:MAG: response regulator [Bacteroidales bacterium]
MNAKKFRILIVDDIPTNIQVLGNILRKAGYEVAFTDNGSDAIDKARKFDYDLILLDIMMPGMDGFETCRLLKNEDETKHIPVIFLTAKSDSDSLVKGFELGAVDYLTKPFKTAELLARVQTHIILKYTTEELKKSNAMKDKLFSIIAHDLRGPVGNFSSALEMLISNLNNMEEELVMETLKDLKHSADRSYDLLQNLLKWARSQNNTIDFRPDTLDLNNIVLENLDLLRHTAAQKQICFHRKLDTNIKVYADENMLNTILRNLFSNAIKFSHRNGNVYVSINRTGKFAEVIIRDEGIGIKEENLQKIFKPYEYFSTYGTNNEKGTGIGLNLVKDFVEHNGGKIAVISEADQGTEFRFTLPYVHDAG